MPRGIKGSGKPALKGAAPQVPGPEWADDVQLEIILKRIFPELGWDDSAGQTASRFLRYLKEFDGSAEPPKMTTFRHEANQLIVASPIEFSSMCQHHLLPFLGYVHVGYVSDGLILGLSKIPRMVDWLAKRPRTQEDLTQHIVSVLKNTLKPKGVMVVMEAIHTCACARGIHKVGMYMSTSLPTGVFRDNAVTRQEFFSLIKLQGGR